MSNTKHAGHFASQHRGVDLSSKSVSIVDAYGFSCDDRERYTVDRLTFALARFGNRITGAAVYMDQDNSSNVSKFDCRINVMLDNSGVVSVKRSGVSPYAALNQAVESVEPRVAFRVDWRSCFNRDTLSRWRNSLNRRMSGLSHYFQRRRLSFWSSPAGN